MEHEALVLNWKPKGVTGFGISYTEDWDSESAFAEEKIHRERGVRYPLSCHQQQLVWENTNERNTETTNQFLLMYQLILNWRLHL